MPSPRDRLQATLVELQDELAELAELDAETRDRLQATLSDIRTALERRAEMPGAGAAASTSGRIADEDDTTLDDEAASESLAERLNDATRGLESTHPELSTTLGGVINALAHMGI
jgi:predicted phage gp36 major capsid-like protein